MMTNYNTSCTTTGAGRCSLESDADRDACIDAVINIRGTPLEQQCYCSSSDATCLSQQAAMLPKNPCVGE